MEEIRAEVPARIGCLFGKLDFADASANVGLGTGHEG
jgi:hypothetical protein